MPLLICQLMQKLSKAHTSKIIQSGGSFGSWLANLGKTQTNVSIPLARDNLPGLVSNLTSSAINKFDRKIYFIDGNTLFQMKI